MNKLAKNIEGFVLEYTRAIAEKYDLQQDDLMEMWTEVTKMKTKAAQAKKPRSAYQVFSAEQRKLLKEEYPDMAFGDIAKEIGKRWSDLSAKEKAAYAENQTTPKKKAKKTSPTGDDSDLKKLSKSRLLEMCNSKGIKIAKNKNKDQIIAAIEEAASEAASVAASEAAVSETMSEAAVSESSYKPSEEASETESVNSSADILSVYKSMKTQDLAGICKDKGLPCKGTREVLIRRLLTSV